MKSKACRRLGRNNKIVKEGNKPKEHIVPRIVGREKLDWLNEHKLNENSHPLEWINATLLTKDECLNGKRKSLFETWTTYTNLRAALMNAGQADSLYPDFKTFTVDAIRQHVGLCVFHGISPSPKIDMKFKDQKHDPVNGNDFISKVFDTNANCRHKHFK